MSNQQSSSSDVIQTIDIYEQCFDFLFLNQLHKREYIHPLVSPSKSDKCMAVIASSGKGFAVYIRKTCRSTCWLIFKLNKMMRGSIMQPVKAFRIILSLCYEFCLTDEMKLNFILMEAHNFFKLNIILCSSNIHWYISYFDVIKMLIESKRAIISFYRIFFFFDCQTHYRSLWRWK